MTPVVVALISATPFVKAHPLPLLFIVPLFISAGYKPLPLSVQTSPELTFIVPLFVKFPPVSNQVTDVSTVIEQPVEILSGARLSPVVRNLTFPG